MNKDILYLASGSMPRKKLLEDAKIDFKILDHFANELEINFSDHFDSYVLDIAKVKMKDAVLPKVEEGQAIFVLTADTLVYTKDSKEILGKPKDIQDAKRMLKIVSTQSVDVVTGCCLEKKILKNRQWQKVDHSYWVTKSQVEFKVEEPDFEQYFKNLPQALSSASGGIIENYGQRFCKTINGSYSNIMGLPIFELVQELKKMNFKF